MDLFAQLSMSRKVLENKEKRCPVGVGEAQGLECGAFSSHMLQEEVAYITGVSHCCPVW